MVTGTINVATGRRGKLTVRAKDTGVLDTIELKISEAKVIVQK